MDKEKFKDVRGWLQSPKLRESLLLECPNKEKVDRFLSRLESVLATDPVTLTAAHHSFREMIRVLKPLVKNDLDFETGIMFRGSKNVNPRGVYTFIAYVTKWGTMEMVNRNPHIVVSSPYLVREGDVFEYGHTAEGGDLKLKLRHDPAYDHDDVDRPIKCGFVYFRVYSPHTKKWREDALVMSAARLRAAASSSRNRDLYTKYPDQMFGNVIIRGLRHVLPLQALESMGILAEDFDTPTGDSPPEATPSSPPKEEEPPAEVPPPPPEPEKKNAAPKKAAVRKKEPAAAAAEEEAPAPAAPPPAPPPPEQPVEDPFGA